MCPSCHTQWRANTLQPSQRSSELLDNWLKSLNWNLGWQITGNSAEDSPLPLSCFFASQSTWTHPHAQGTPAAAEGKTKPGMQTCYSGSDTEHVAGSSKTATRWIPPGHWPGILQQQALVCMTSRCDFSHLILGIQNRPQVTSQRQEGSGARRQTMKPTKDSKHLLPGHYDLGLVHNP